MSFFPPHLYLVQPYSPRRGPLMLCRAMVRFSSCYSPQPHLLWQCHTRSYRVLPASCQLQYCQLTFEQMLAANSNEWNEWIDGLGIVTDNQFRNNRRTKKQHPAYDSTKVSNNEVLKDHYLVFGILKDDRQILVWAPKEVGCKNHGKVVNVHACGGSGLWLNEDLDDCRNEIGSTCKSHLFSYTDYFIFQTSQTLPSWPTHLQKRNDIQGYPPIDLRQAINNGNGTLNVLRRFDTVFIELGGDQRIGEVAQPKLEQRRRNARVRDTLYIILTVLDADALRWWDRGEMFVRHENFSFVVTIPQTCNVYWNWKLYIQDRWPRPHRLGL